MALFLVLSDFEAELAGERHALRSGDVVDDGIGAILPPPFVPVAGLVPLGLATLPYVAGMDAAIAAFVGDHGRDEPRPSIVGTLVAFGAMPDPLVPLTGIVNPNGVVTGVFGQRYYDSVGLVWYSCTSTPTGTAWGVL